MWGYAFICPEHSSFVRCRAVALSDLSSSHVSQLCTGTLASGKDLACYTNQACMPSTLYSMDSSSQAMHFRDGCSSCVVYQAGMLSLLARDPDVHH